MGWRRTGLGAIQLGLAADHSSCDRAGSGLNRQVATVVERWFVVSDAFSPQGWEAQCHTGGG